jgi:hypothetical protein
MTTTDDSGHGPPAPSDPTDGERQTKRGQLHIGNPSCVCGHMLDEHGDALDGRGEWRCGVCPCDEFDEGDDDG